MSLKIASRQRGFVVALAPRAPVVSRLRGHAATALGVVMAVAVRAITPHKASIRRLADIPLTVAGGGCIDFSAFHVAHGWGWLVTGVSLVLLEHLIADDT